VFERMLEHADSAIASVASLAGMGWRARVELLRELVETPDFGAAKQWCQAHPSELTRAYGLSKEAVNLYTAMRAATLASRGIRLNCLNPGATDTPMIAAHDAANGTSFLDDFAVPLGRYAQPHEQAWPLLFLNSPRASFVTGAHLDADGGLGSALVTGPAGPPSD
jgi:NAD(P)-dependent dehydrogenase (short-subunit alcohol dehydrogenase family)